MPINLSEIPGAFHLPRPNWDVIRDWIDARVPEPDRPAAWTEVAHQWLAILNEALDSRYHTTPSTHLLLFAPRDYEHTHALLNFAEAGLAAIEDALGSLTGKIWLGPLAVLLFADAEAYSRYTAPFVPEGELFQSGGLCLRQRGHVHIALHPFPLDALRRSMLHEITHACLAHLTLPLWLEEGVTQLAEEVATSPWARFALDRESATNIRSFWLDRGLQDFWWGQGFYSLGETQRHSYQLAQILFHFLVADHRRKLPDLVRQAHADEAGESAAQAVLGQGLAELAAQFLGTGPWEPVPPDAPSFCRRGALYLSRKQFDQAIADFNSAIQLDPKFSNAYSNRGLARNHLLDYAAAAADYEQAIDLNPNDLYAHNDLAWLLATCPDDERRNGALALHHANRACELNGFGQWFCLGTLAAAYAEVGDFEEARTWARESLRLAPAEERPACSERLKLFKVQQPYRDLPNQPLPAPKTPGEITSQPASHRNS